MIEGQNGGQCLSQKSLAMLNVNKLDLLPFQANTFSLNNIY